MRPAPTFVLDNEAVQALIDAHHPKHRRTTAAFEAIVRPTGAHLGRAYVVVPTSVRVEAGWDRTAKRAAVVNRLQVADHVLDAAAANAAARIRAALDVSVADAHLGHVMATTPGAITVITSDTTDVRRMADHVGADPVIVRL